MKKFISILFIAILSISMYSCSSDDEPISIEGSWIVTKWSDGGKMVTPDQVVRWRFSNGKAYCLGETMSYTLDGNKLKARLLIRDQA